MLCECQLIRVNCILDSGCTQNSLVVENCRRPLKLIWCLIQRMFSISDVLISYALVTYLFETTYNSVSKEERVWYLNIFYEWKDLFMQQIEYEFNLINVWQRSCVLFVKAEQQFQVNVGIGKQANIIRTTTQPCGEWIRNGFFSVIIIITIFYWYFIETKNRNSISSLETTWNYALLLIA